MKKITILTPDDVLRAKKQLGRKLTQPPAKAQAHGDPRGSGHGCNTQTAGSPFGKVA